MRPEASSVRQVTHKNLDEYARELVEDCVSKMRIDEQVNCFFAFFSFFGGFAGVFFPLVFHGAMDNAIFL